MTICANGCPSLKSALIVQIVTSSVMLAYFLALITIAALKYKVYGFAFRMLVGLAIEVLAILIVTGLTFSFVKLNENGVSIKSTEIVNRVIGLIFVQLIVVSVGPSLFWIFALKYWSVALKFELAARELDITSKTKIVNALLVGGLVYLVLVPLISAVILVFHPSNDFKRTFKVVVSLVLIGMLMSCLILFDAFRRMIQSKIQNNTISIKAVFFLSLSFIGEFVSISISLDNLKNFDLNNPIIAPQIASIYGIQITYTFAFVVFAQILFNICYSSAQTSNYEAEIKDFRINDVEGLLDEDNSLEILQSSNLRQVSQPESDEVSLLPKNAQLNFVLEAKTGQNRVSVKISKDEMMMLGTIMKKP